MTASAALIIALVLPFLGAILMWVLAPLGRDAVRYGALSISIAVFLVCMGVVCSRPAAGEVFAVTNVAWLSDSAFQVRFDVGLDGLGLWMFALTGLLFITAVLVSWEAIRDREPLFYGMLLLLEFGCLGVFAARDLLLFYTFFEFTLIPLFFLIGIWGSEERRYAAIKFFLFTLAGSVLTFLGLLAVVMWDHNVRQDGTFSFSIAQLQATCTEHPMSPAMQQWVFLALFAGFAIKVPLFPVHTWLPLAHVQAPTAGSVILAGVLLKIGVYGFVRFNLALTPEASLAAMPWMLTLAAVGIVYGALTALAQSDMKRLIAYSSVSHLGYCILGIFALNPLGLHGGLLQMVNHGLSTGGLFAVIGMLYERYHTREIGDYSGLAAKLPRLACFMLLFTFASIGLPGLNGFPGELFVLQGMFQRAWSGAPGISGTNLMLISLTALTGVVLGAWYMLHLVKSVFFGPLREPHGEGDEHAEVSDLNLREMLALAPIAVMIVWIGLRPNDFVRPVDQAVRSTLAVTDKPLKQDRSGATAAMNSPSIDREVTARVR